MLEHFQKALAELAASPEFVSDVVERPELLRERYYLSDREYRRLVSVVNQPGMKCSCMLYRANRLTPIAAYLPELCEALGDDLNPLLSEYWEHFTHTNLNFLVEAYRFCRFLEDRIDAGSLNGDILFPILERESAGLSMQIDEIFGDKEDGIQPRNDIAVLFAGAGITI